jgi:hypothetical protein
MLGFSQITRRHTPVAVSAPGGGTVDGHELPATMLWWHAYSPWVIRQAR